MRFLVIRLSSIGDIVNTLPAVAALGTVLPETEITWVVEKRFAGLLEGNPYVNRTINLDTLGWRKRLRSPVTLGSVAKGIAQLRSGNFDVAVDFQGLIKSGLIARLSGAPERLGLSEPWLKERLAALFYTDRVAARGCHHVIEENMALVAWIADRFGDRTRAASIRSLGPAEWQFPLGCHPDQEQAVERRLAEIGVEGFIVINPGGGWITKRWAPENYAELVRRLEPETPWQFLFTGSPEEEPLISQIVERAGSRRASLFRSSLFEFIALARRAKLFIGGDTGPLHLAAALGTPIVAIYGPTDPARNGPFSPEDIALSNRGPIDHSRRDRNATYLAGIAVDAVVEAVRERLRRVRG